MSMLISQVAGSAGSLPRGERRGELVSLAERQWRRAVLTLRGAEIAYRQLLDDVDAPEREVDLAWLNLWRAERRRDHLLRFMRDTDQI